MVFRFRQGSYRALCAAATLLTVAAAGCSYIADKDLIVIAEIDGEPVTRGDFKRVLREMSDDDRPLIQNRADLIRSVNDYINRIILDDYVQSLRATNAISVDRSRAEALYFEKHPELRTAYLVTDPAQMGMSEGELVAIRSEIEFGIDDEEAALLRDAAVRYKATEMLQQGRLSIQREEVQREYDLRKESLRHLEAIDFIGLRFPVDPQGFAAQEAANARRRIDGGESFDAVLEDYVSRNPALGIRSALENNPELPKFKMFWETATGAEPGTVLGPLYLPEHEMVGQTADGQLDVREMPAAYVVVQVLERRAPTIKTFEEAANELAAEVADRKALAALRQEHRVQIFEDKMPDPAGYGDQFKDSMIQTDITER